ncbi:anti-repressor SinI family protein [Paenibacillus sp. V4I7]|uniref:anti-repressor SinI family protein n=1 Tax=Paenibacillus sp. V4I7 TaxID=3042307 RepID=UPI0027D80293|nr:anti-repressor SinI family protein [Paenibacillus sp. V4I7]
MNRINQVDTEEFDKEWVNLIMSARKMGLTMEDIRAFLRSPFQPTTISLSTENDRFMSSKGFIQQSS